MKPRFAEISSADGRQNGAELAPRDNGDTCSGVRNAANRVPPIKGARVVA